MIHEYALEPELVATWVDRSVGRFFIDKFGLGQPRIASRYPRKWKKLVYEAFRGGKELDRKRLEEIVQRIGEMMVQRRCESWDTNRTWLDNACIEHARMSFHAILARSNPDAHPAVLTADKIEATPPLGRPERLRYSEDGRGYG